MEEQDSAAMADEDEDDAASYAQLDELEKLETIIAYMEELEIDTLETARTRYATLERSIDSDNES